MFATQHKIVTFKSYKCEPPMKLLVLISLFILQFTGTFGQKSIVSQLQFDYNSFIENIGQYGDKDLQGFEKAKFFFENKSAVSAFFPNGFTITDISNKRGIISFYFDGCNTDIGILYENKSGHYYTFDSIQKRSL